MTSLLATTIDIQKQLQDVPFWKSGDLAGLLSKLIGVGIVFAGVVAFVFLIFGALRWITSAGNKEQLTTAQNTITNALVGLVIIFAAWAILSLVKYFFGLSGTPTNPTPRGQFDCCTIIGGDMEDKFKCCNLVDSYGCVSGRFQSSSTDCHKLKIDWNCWRKKFKEGEPSPDPNKYCESN